MCFSIGFKEVAIVKYKCVRNWNPDENDKNYAKICTLDFQSLTEEATNMQDCTMLFLLSQSSQPCTQCDSGSIPVPNLAYFFATRSELSCQPATQA